MSVQAAIYDTIHSDVIIDIGESAQQCVVSTNLRGFAEAQIAVFEPNLDEQLRLAARAAMPHFCASDNAAIAYEGRVEDPPIGGETIQLRAFGYARAFDDIPYNALWSITSTEDYDAVTSDVIGARVPEKFVMDKNNRLFIGQVKGTNYAAGERASWRYIFPASSNRKIIGLQFAYAINSQVNFNGKYVAVEEDYATGAAVTFVVGNGGAQTGAAHIVLGTARPVIFFEFSNDTGGAVAYAGENGVNYLKVTNVRLVTATTNRVNTTLTLGRTNGSPVTCTVASTAGMYVGMQLVINSGNVNSEMVTVLSVPSSTTFTANVVNAPGGGYLFATPVQGFAIYADEIAKDLVSVATIFNPTQLSAATGLIASPGLDLTDEVYEDAKMSAILDRLAAYGDTALRRWNWWVAKDKTLVLEQRAARAYTWYVDVSPGDIRIERSADDVANNVYVVFQEPKGRTVRSTAATDATSIARYGITRQLAIQTQTTIPGQVNPIRDTTLAEKKNPQPRIRITVDRLYDATGNEVPLWSANAGRGDTIVIRNLSPVLPGDADQIRRFRLGRTSVDLLAGTLTLESEDPVSTLDAVLAAGARKQAAWLAKISSHNTVTRRRVGDVENFQ